jgi:hypothetical protein
MHRTYTFPSQPMQFQRGKGKINPKKIKRKAKLKFRHILFFFFLLGGIFYFIQQAYLWLEICSFLTSATFRRPLHLTGGLKRLA